MDTDVTIRGSRRLQMGKIVGLKPSLHLKSHFRRE